MTLNDEEITRLRNNADRLLADKLRLLDEVECLRDENAKLRREISDPIVLWLKLTKACEALQFYADGHKDLRGKPEKHEYRALCDRCRDKGDRARQALKEIGE